MAKVIIVGAAKAALLAAQDGAIDTALSSAYDGGAVDQKVSDGTLTQADLDAAVKAATDPLNAQIASDATALAAAHADADAAAASAKAALDAMTADDAVKSKAVSDLQGSVAAVQAALDSIKALLSPPTPVPAPPAPPVPVPPAS
jgi:hypothetical protein